MTNKFQPGNEIWQLRSTFTAGEIMNDPQKLYDECLAYFKWVKENPLKETKVGFFMGQAIHTEIPKMRAMTIKGLCIYLGIVDKTWYSWRKERDHLKGVMEWAEQVIFEQKLSGAAAGLLTPSIIIRELGLADRQVHVNETPRMVINPPDGAAPEEPPIHGEE